MSANRIAQDPICGKEVDTLRARAVGIFGGVTYYFCSVECKAKYVDPRKQPRPAVEPPRPAEPSSSEPEAPEIVEPAAAPVESPLALPYEEAVSAAANAPERPAPAAASASEGGSVAHIGATIWALLAVVLVLIASAVLVYALNH